MTGRSDECLAPVSFQQTEMLRRLRTFPECAARYDVLRVFEVEGPLRLDCLAAALADVAQRHDVLRTVIGSSDGDDVQRVRSAFAADTVRVCAVEDRAAFIEQLLDQRHGTREVLSSQPLFRPQIGVLGTHRHLLSVTIHHVIFDGLSLFVLWRDLSECYAARLEERPARLPALPTTYGEYARRQRHDWPAQARRAVPFWRDAVAGAPREVHWPRQRPRPEAASYETAEHEFSLTPGLVEAVVRAGRAAKVTQFLVLLAATGAAVARITGQRDVLLGTDFANRDEATKQHLVGCFLNTRLTRVGLGGGRSMRDLVLDVRERWLDAEEQRDAYLDQVLQELGIPALTSVHLDVRDEFTGPQFPAVKVTPVRIDRRDGYWREVLFTWRAGPGGYRGEIVYRPSVVAPDTIAAVAAEIVEGLRRLPVQ